MEAIGADPEITQMTQTERAAPALCETCLERGRERQADVVTEHLQMCSDCYGGNPFRQEERGGDPGDPQRLARQRRYKARQRSGVAPRRYRTAGQKAVREKRIGLPSDNLVGVEDCRRNFRRLFEGRAES